MVVIVEPVLELVSHRTNGHSNFRVVHMSVMHLHTTSWEHTRYGFKPLDISFMLIDAGSWSTYDEVSIRDILPALWSSDSIASFRLVSFIGTMLLRSFDMDGIR